MKVLLVNGSPRREGNTFTALTEVAKTLGEQGIETEIVHIGNRPVRGCIGCGKCRTDNPGRCVFDDDVCNAISAKLADADGFVFGSPVFQTMNMAVEMMNMPIVTSQYWNIAYGRNPGETADDAEGMQTMRTLARNMAWLLSKLRAEGEDGRPELEAWTPTSFIR